MAAGITFSVLAAIALNSGNVVQKHAVNALPRITAKDTRHLVRTLASSRLWMGGFVVCLAGVGFQVLAFALAPIAVVQSIFNASIVLLLILSRLRLHEHLQRFEWAGLVVVVASVAAISATLRSTPSAVNHSGSISAIVVAVVPTLIVAVILVLGVEGARRLGALRFGIAAGLLYGAAALGTKGASTLVARDGLASSVSAIATSIYPYLFIVFSSIGMLVYQMGIQRFRIAVVGALSDVVNSTYVVAVGTIVFGESLPQDHAMRYLRLGGFVGVLAGTLLVAGGGLIGKEGVPPLVESDLGLGPVLTAEVVTIRGGSRRPIDVPDLYLLSSRPQGD